MDIQKILNAERFNLLSQEEQTAVNDLRSQGQIPTAYNQLNAEEIQGFKEIVNIFLPQTKEVEWNDYDYANMYQTKETVKGVFTNPENWELAAATAGGIIAPTILPGIGQATLPARVAAIITKYPRLAKIVSAFMGGTGASYPLAESGQEALGYGVFEAAGESVFQSGAWVWKNRKFLQNMAKSEMEPGAATALKQLDASGQILTPSIVSNNRVIDTLENIAANAWVGGGSIRTARKGAMEAATKDLGDFLNTKFVLNNKELSKVTDDFIEVFLNNGSQKNMDMVLKDFLLKGQAVQQSLIKTGYRNLDTIVKKLTNNNDIVSAKSLKSYAKNISKLEIDPGVKEILKEIANLPDNVSFAYAQQLRSRFLNKAGKLKDISSHVSGQIQKIIDGSMEKSIGGIIKDQQESLAQSMFNKSFKALTKEEQKAVAAKNVLGEAWRGANSVYKASKSTFQSDLMVKLVKGDADKVFSSLLQGKHPQRVAAFHDLIFKTAVKDGVLENKLAAKKLWRSIQGEFFVDTIGRSIDKETRTLSAKSLLGHLKTWSGRGDRAIKELFKDSPQLLSDFKSFARTLELAQSKGMKNVPGGMFIQLVQAGAISAVPTLATGALTGDVAWAGSAGVVSMGLVLGGPKLIAKLFTSPNFIKGLTSTTRHEVGSGMYTRGALQVISAMTFGGIMTEDQAKAKVQEGIQVGALNENAMKTYNSIVKYNKDTELRKEREKKIVKKVKEKTSEFIEWTGLS